MSQKRDSSASLSDEETKKKVKLDASSSSGSASAIGTAASEDSLKPLMESRDKAHTDSSSLNIHDHRSQTENMGSPSSSSIASPSSSREEQSLAGLIDGESSERKLVYMKKLTYSDIYHEMMMIPVECAAVLSPGLKRRIILPVMDSKRQLWHIEAVFDEFSYCYNLRANWDTFVNEHRLRPEDKIFIYQDPKLDYSLIEYEKRGGNGQLPGRVAAEDK